MKNIGSEMELILTSLFNAEDFDEKKDALRSLNNNDLKEIILKFGRPFENVNKNNLIEVDSVFGTSLMFDDIFNSVENELKVF